MNGATIPALVAVGLQLGLGLIVFQANWQRRANQGFLFLSITAAIWLASLHFAFTATDPDTAAWAIREAWASGALILAALNLLRLSLTRTDWSWLQIVRHSRFWILGALGAIYLCQTRWFVIGAQLSGPIGFNIPKAVYGSGGALVYGILFVAGAIAMIVNSARDLRKADAGKRAELGFVMVGGLFALIGPLLVTFVLRSVVDPERLLPFAPLRVVLFTGVVAYGVATRKIMDVGLLIRRLISYSLLTLYLLLLYAAVWWLVSTALQSTLEAHAIAHVAAGVVIAFAMAPARGVSRRLAERLFISPQQLDFRATVSKATEILSSITTLHDLLQRFGGTIAEAVAAERVLILLPGRDEFVTDYGYTGTKGLRVDYRLPTDGPVASYLKTHREPVVLDELYRVRRTPEIVRLSERMRELNVSVAMGIFSREHLAGIMLLGPRLSGRIYGGVEQSALQVLCGQLAVAIDNAQLFTAVQNARIYNETLLQNLTTGVIAAGVDERITVFNNEAGQITGIDPKDILDKSIDQLPAPVRDALRETLQTGQSRERNEEMVQSEAEDIAVRVSTSIFHGQEGEVLGALMVLTDVTALKRLETQIRRSDRLASLGTLSAGMAHEIKNPLVSIKTFAQLLPERYNDADFRDTFSNLIGHEIDRIDSLVNQLLRFARPAKPHLEPSHVHDILEKSLLLVGHRLYQKDIKLTRSWQANVDTIRADSDQLEQVFLNFFINAMDAMKNGGDLNITTEIRTAEEWVSPLPQNNDEAPELLRISIRDSGEGIRGEDLAHVFDPFFTTKDYGTGLGLSVVHGIIQEHGGQIEVESELTKGTAFHISLPLVRFDREVAAA
jgi:PAS domain S-box-containing protein